MIDDPIYLKAGEPISREALDETLSSLTEGMSASIEKVGKALRSLGFSVGADAARGKSALDEEIRKWVDGKPTISPDAIYGEFIESKEMLVHKARRSGRDVDLPEYVPSSFRGESVLSFQTRVVSKHGGDIDMMMIEIRTRSYIVDLAYNPRLPVEHGGLVENPRIMSVKEDPRFR